MIDEQVPLSAVANKLHSALDDIIAHGEEFLLEQVPSYRRVPILDLRQAIRYNTELGILALASGTGTPPLDDLDDFSRRVTIRARQATIPVEDILRGTSLSLEPLYRAFTRLVGEMRLGNDCLLVGTRRLWELVNVLNNRAAQAYQDHLVLTTLADIDARSDFVHKVLHREYSDEQLAVHAQRYGLDPHADRLFAVQAQVIGVEVESIWRQLERAGSTSEHRAVIGRSAGHYIGIMYRRPDPVPGMVIGVGSAATLADISESFRISGLVRTAAGRAGRSGVFGVEDMTWRLIVDTEPVVIEMLERKYLDPLRNEHEFGVLIEKTVSAYLDHDRDLNETARSLHIHPNTARYRLNRFGELTGVSLSSVSTLVELVLLLEHRAGAQPEPPR